MNEKVLPNVPDLQYAMLFWSVPGTIDELKWWLTYDLVNNDDLFHMYLEIDNN